MCTEVPPERRFNVARIPIDTSAEVRILIFGLVRRGRRRHVMRDAGA